MSSAAPALARVLCATDLSEFGNRALPLAFAITAPGGRVTLLHVLKTPDLPSPLVPHYGEKHPSEDELDEHAREHHARLTELARPFAKASDLAFQVRIVRAPSPSEAILAEARRLHADAICLATHSRSGMAELIMGSAAHEVLQGAHRPVLLVPPPADG
jgi:nucleotide-binding universal stress UspA family protein